VEVFGKPAAELYIFCQDFPGEMHFDGQFYRGRIRRDINRRIAREFFGCLLFCALARNREKWAIGALFLDSITVLRDTAFTTESQYRVFSLK
jgi:hypothetical protein